MYKFIVVCYDFHGVVLKVGRAAIYVGAVGMALVIASQQKLLSVMPSRGLLFFYMLKRACLVEN
jgi:hypothetical protein